MFKLLNNCRRRQQDLFNAMGSMYASVIFIGVQNGTSVQPVVGIERTVFYREKAAGMYSALPYAFAQVLIASTIWFMSSKTETLFQDNFEKSTEIKIHCMKIQNKPHGNSCNIDPSFMVAHQNGCFHVVLMKFLFLTDNN